MAAMSIHKQDFAAQGFEGSFIIRCCQRNKNAAAIDVHQNLGRALSASPCALSTLMSQVVEVLIDVQLVIITQHCMLQRLHHQLTHMAAQDRQCESRGGKGGGGGDLQTAAQRVAGYKGMPSWTCRGSQAAEPPGSFGSRPCCSPDSLEIWPEGVKAAVLYVWPIPWPCLLPAVEGASSCIIQATDIAHTDFNMTAKDTWDQAAEFDVLIR